MRPSIKSLAAALLLAAGPAGAETARRPSVLLVVLDALRADRTPAYGYGAAAMPELRRFAGGAVVYENACADSVWTAPSFASILTGLRPFSHGLLGYYDAVRPGVPTLPEALSAAGYETAAFLGGLAGERAYGYARGFGTWSAAPAGTPFAERAAAAAAWAQALPPEKDFFLLVHGLDIHNPRDCGAPAPGAGPPQVDAEFLNYYNGTPEADLARLDAARWRKVLAYKKDPAFLDGISRDYDRCAASLDEGLGRLLRGLGEARGRPLLIIVTADHGQLLGEHGLIGHVTSIYEPLLRVPLLIRYPGGAGGRSAVPAEHADLLATVCAAAGAACPAGDGRDLAAADAAPREHAAVTGAGPKGRPARVSHAAFFRGTRKLARLGPRWALFDLKADPGEGRDISSAEPVEFLSMAAGYLALSGAGALALAGPRPGEESFLSAEPAWPAPRAADGTPCGAARAEAGGLAARGGFDKALAVLAASGCPAGAVRGDREALGLLREAQAARGEAPGAGAKLSASPGKWSAAKGGYTVLFSGGGLACEKGGRRVAEAGCAAAASALLDAAERYRAALRRETGGALEEALRKAGYIQ